MTDEKKTHSLEEIVESFNNKCHCNYDNDYDTEDCRPCDYCKILNPNYDSLEYYKNGKWVPGCDGSWDSQGECERNYIYEVATGKRPLDKPLWNPPKTPEWFKVGAKLWRKSYNDWYTITALEPKGFDDDDGEALFAVEMVASDGSEDTETLTAVAFATEAPFSESFRELFVKRRALHKGLGLVVEITDYIYEDNEVHFSYYNKDGVSISATEELHEENFDAVVEAPSWCKVGQWVMGYDKTLGVIIEVDDCKGNIMPFARIRTIGASHITSITLSGVAQYYTPIRFRPYRYEEAKGLLGKTMETSYYDGDFKAELIVRVYHHASSGEVTINGLRFDGLALAKEGNTTIDGHPFGVPEIDEEAMKGGENDE